MNNSQGLISVIIPLHNKEAFVADTLASLVSQTHTNWEAIVVENGSTDDGADVASRFPDSRVKLIRAPADVRGPAVARNLGLAQANGEWILFLDADDLIESEHLHTLMSLSRVRTDASIIVGGWQEFNHGGEKRNRIIRRPAGEQPGSNLLASSICNAPWAIHSAIISRKILENVQWDTRLDKLLAEDICFWFQLCNRAVIAYSPTQHALYRTQTENCRTKRFDVRQWYDGIHAATRLNLEYLKCQNREPSNQQCEMLVHCYENLYSQARRSRDGVYAALAHYEATCWLKKRFSRPETSGRTMQLRRLLGISLYQFIKSALTTAK
jgi:glycosyltransferase involved in cell wall biosynthesis